MRSRLRKVEVVMRNVVVFLALAGMLGTVRGIGALRARPSLPEAAEGDTADPTPAPPGEDAEGAGPTQEGDSESDTDAEPTKLSVTALSWEVLAPGIVANAGTTTSIDSRFSKARLDVKFAVAADTASMQSMLGRGGEHADGADLALVPLPEFVASYERLRALSPEAFSVVAWSRGRGAIVGNPRMLQGKHRKHVELAGKQGASETLVGLFALDQAGVQPSASAIVDP